VEDGEFDPDAAVPMALVVGNTPAAMAVTVRLLTDRFDILVNEPNAKIHKRRKREQIVN